MRVWVIILIIILLLVIAGTVYVVMTYQKKLQEAQLQSVAIENEEEKTDVMKYFKYLFLI